MAKKAQYIWNRSLLLKLSAPIVVVGVVLMLVLAMIVRKEGNNLEKVNAIQLAQLIIDDIVIAAQVDGSRANLIRVINSLGAFKTIEFIALIDRQERKIIASSKNKLIDQPPEAVQQLGFALRNASRSWADNELYISQVGNEYSFVSTIDVYDPKILAIKKIDVLMVIDIVEANAATERAVRFTIFSMVAATVLLIIGFGLILRRVLFLRLSQLKKLILDEMAEGGFASSSITVGDELDHVRIMFIEMLGAKKNAELETRRALAAAKKSSDAKSDFMANMSHELRTPLNSIIGFSKRILRTETNLDERQKRSMDAIYKNGHHLLSMINDVLDLSKIDAGRLEMKIVEADISVICEGLYHQFNEEAEKKDLSIRFYIGNEIYGLVDELRFKQVAINLISNAIKYTEAGEIIVKLAKESEEFLCFSVRDTGIGIKDEDQERLFKRFEQFDDKSRFQIGQGTGLGLSIVNEIVSLMNGRVLIESTVGVGTNFKVYIPAIIQSIRHR